ncbi:CsiV family protein [Agaribacter flavus]|uniref:CsiV family protein n=1 Tax=Agaribacter flavus TaxID=1902781 RepID=A0ABV7FQK3_9ALTE
MGKFVNYAIALLANAAILSTLLAPSPVHAQDEQEEWWFDVEFAVFKRNLQSDTLAENFEAAAYVPSNEIGIDLFSLPIIRQQSLHFDIFRSLPHCNPAPLPQIIDLSETIEALSYSPFVQLANNEERQSEPDTSNTVLPEIASSEVASPAIALPENEPLASTSAAQDEPYIDWLNYELEQIDTRLNLNLSCYDDSLPNPVKQTPTRLFVEGEYADGQHRVLDKSNLKMESFVESVFKQRDIAPLLYTIWRQQVVFGEKNARFIKVFAGEKIKLDADKQAESEPDIELLDDTEETFIQILSSIKQELGSGKPVEWNTENTELDSTSNITQDFSAFELEGLFKVYLEYVGRVPYLHIDSEFMHYRLKLDASGNKHIQSFPFKQRRRIISKQIHYFDHPAIGIIVRLHRYQVPKTN